MKATAGCELAASANDAEFVTACDDEEEECCCPMEPAVRDRLGDCDEKGTGDDDVADDADGRGGLLFGFAVAAACCCC